MSGDRDQRISQFEKLKNTPQHVINEMTVDQYTSFKKNFMELHFELFPHDVMCVPSKQQPINTKKHDEVKEDFKNKVIQSVALALHYVKYPNNPRDLYSEFDRILKDKLNGVNYAI
ncbi:hypothetical protein ma757 [Moumouvirus australiensis]|uniref:Uncharacterized protein n=1 Tax=Moumouvirus australiensis TaxID=2109587 RepID=A0A2P1EML7_9VIRU|nr:hypothetical protein QKC55_gp147 [Moumouvirus australiensis]AVL95144.1 hypothetical protein ma757 [Moumouvirus australiensis]